MERPPSPSRPLKRVNKEQGTRKMAKKNFTALGSLKNTSKKAPFSSPRENQPQTSKAVKQAVNDLKVFVAKAHPDEVLFRKGLLTVRLEKEHGQGDPPFVVPNDEVFYFGYEALAFEATKFGSTLQASRMSEPEGFATLLWTPGIGYESPAESSLRAVRFAKTSLGKDTPVTQPGVGELVEPARASFEDGPEYWYNVFKTTMSEFL